jgi:hypothetical protein
VRELGKHGRQVDGTDGGDRAHAQVTADEPGHFLDGQPHSVNSVQGGPGIRQNGGTDLCRADGTSRAVEQCLSELSFKQANLSAHTWLGHMASLSGPGEIGFLDDGHQVLQLPQLHKRRL